LALLAIIALASVLFYRHRKGADAEAESTSLVVGLDGDQAGALRMTNPTYVASTEDNFNPLYNPSTSSA